MTISHTKKAMLSAVTIALAMPMGAFAQSSAPLSGLFACEAIKGDRAQLACFRAETVKLRAEETSGEIIAIEKDRFEEIKKEEVKVLARETKKAKKAEENKVRTLAIRSAKTFGPNRYMRFTLENGEIWQQNEAATVRLGRGDEDVLVIKRGAIGGHRARVNDKRPSFRVKRVK